MNQASKSKVGRLRRESRSSCRSSVSLRRLLAFFMHLPRDEPWEASEPVPVALFLSDASALALFWLLNVQKVQMSFTIVSCFHVIALLRIFAPLPATVRLRRVHSTVSLFTLYLKSRLRVMQLLMYLRPKNFATPFSLSWPMII